MEKFCFKKVSPGKWGIRMKFPFFPLVHMSTYRPIPLGPSTLNNVPLYNNPPGDRLGLRLPHVILLLFPRGIHAMARYMTKGEGGKNQPASGREKARRGPSIHGTKQLRRG